MSEMPRPMVRYVRAEGRTLKQMKAGLPEEFRAKGDAILVWANEGDLYTSGVICSEEKGQ